MTKWRLRLPGLLAACAGVGLLVGCGVHPDVEHEVAEIAPAPLLDVGPEAGRPEQVWRATLRAVGSEPSTYRLAGGNLVVLTKTGLVAYDATTGQAAWSYREPGRRIWGAAETDGAIALNTYKGEQKDGSEQAGDKHLVGLDAGTGKQLWEKSEDWFITAAGDARSGTPPDWGDAAGGTVVIQPDSPSERIGLDARTGEQRWRIEDRDVLGDCAKPRPEPKPRTGEHGSGPLLPARFGCGAAGGSMSVALDAASGRPRWHRPSPGDVTLRGEIGLYSRFDAPPVLIGPDGGELFRAPKGSSCLCELYANGSGVVLLYQSKAHEGGVLVSVDPDTRAAKPLQAWTGSDRSGLSAVAGGRFYDLRSSLLPPDPDRLRADLKLSGLVVAELSAGSVRSVPLLPAGPLRTAAEHDGDQGSWLGAGGGRLFLATQPRSGSDPSGPPVVTSFAVRDPKQPVELGGVPPGAWPDPCRLLAGIPDDPALRTPLRAPEAELPLTVGSTRVPATSCAYETRGDAAELTVVARVRVLWVAATGQEAAALFGEERSTRHGGNQERADGSSGGLVARVGRTIITVQASGAGERRDAVYRKVIENLRALG
ncbi:PQQ-binding-like beta-propeller repeat protein [Flindersiella endophytica]